MTRSLSPTKSGTMWVVLDPVSQPAAQSPSRSSAARSSRASRRAGSSRTMRRAARAAPTDPGGSPQVKMKARLVLTRDSRTSSEQATQAPKLPSALPRLPIWTSTPTPQAAAVPRPSGPRTPSPWASSTTTHMSCARAMGTSASSRATSPSILYTPSSTRIRRRKPASPEAVRARSSASLWRNTRVSARLSRQASIVLAWFRASLTITSPGPASAVSTPRFAIYPVL